MGNNNLEATIASAVLALNLFASSSRVEDVSIEEKQLIKKVERALNGADTSLDYSIHKPNGELVVKVLDKETGKVIREFPNEKILDIIDNLSKQSGLVIDKRR